MLVIGGFCERRGEERRDGKERKKSDEMMSMAYWRRIDLLIIVIAWCFLRSMNDIQGLDICMCFVLSIYSIDIDIM